MTDSALVARFRQFLLWLTVALCLGVIAELLLTEHTKEPLQWAPLIVCGLGAAAAHGRRRLLQEQRIRPRRHRADPLLVRKLIRATDPLAAP